MKQKTWLVSSLALALVILLSPWASQAPDGLNKVAQDQAFSHHQTPGLAKSLPFFRVFNSYTVRGINTPSWSKVAAGVAGSLVVFGLTWGLGTGLGMLAKRTSC